MPMLSPRFISLALTFTLSSLLSSSAAVAQQQRSLSSGAKKPRSQKKPPAPVFSVEQFLGETTVEPSPISVMFNEALRLTQRKKYAEAEKVYRKLLKIEPAVSAGWANLALLVARSPARNTEAIGYLQKATGLEPKSAPFWAQLASLYSRAGRWSDAAGAAQKALAIDKKNEAAIANLAGARFQQQRYAEAIPYLRSLRAAHPRDRQTEVSLIFALRQAGKSKEALELARAAAKRLPNDANAQLMLGDIAGQMGLYSDARNAYAAAYDLQPNTIPAGLSTAIASAMNGNRNEAVSILQKLIERFPDDARAHFQLGYLTYTDPKQTTLERYKRAEALFRTATLRDPRNAQYIAYQGIAIMVQGPERYPEAERLFNAALKVAPSSSQFALMSHMGLANIRQGNAQWEAASREYRAALAISPGDYSARRGLAGVLYAGKKKDEAYKEFGTLAAQNPKDTSALMEMASLLVSDNRLPEALKAYQQALSRNPALTKARSGMGQIYEIQKEPALAQKQYELALATDPKFAPAALQLADLLNNQNKEVQAAAILEKAVEADPKSNPVRYRLGMTYFQMKRYDDSLKHLRALTIQKDDNNRIEYLISPTRVLAAQKRYDDAIRDLRRLRVENPQEDRIAYLLVATLEAAGKEADAETILKELAARPVEKPEQSVDARISLAQLQLRRKDWTAAAENFEDILRIQPANYIAFSGLRDAGKEMKTPERAMNFLELLVTGDAGEPDMTIVEVMRKLHDNSKSSDKFRDFTRQLAKKYSTKKPALQAHAEALLRDMPDDARKNEAVETYRRIAALNPKDGKARYDMGLVYESLGKKDEAIAAYNDALKADPRTQAAEAALRRMGAPVPTASEPNASPTPPPAPAGKTTGASEK